MLARKRKERAQRSYRFMTIFLARGYESVCTSIIGFRVFENIRESRCLLVGCIVSCQLCVRWEAHHLCQGDCFSVLRAGFRLLFDFWLQGMKHVHTLSQEHL